jgi:hypothetical protein
MALPLKNYNFQQILIAFKTDNSQNKSQTTTTHSSAWMLRNYVSTL